MRTTKILSRLRGYAGYLESSLGVRFLKMWLIKIVYMRDFETLIATLELKRKQVLPTNIFSLLTIIKLI